RRLPEPVPAWHAGAMLALALLALLQAAPAVPAPSDAIEADWHDIPDDELLVMNLAGNHQVVIRLAPRYAPAHVAKRRLFARAGWWDGTSVYRVQDNYVAQWGDATEKKQLPPLVVENPPAEYEWAGFDAVTTLARGDSYAARTGHSADGWTLGSDG